ncbi:MAG: permease, partial [Candidatus Eisenbacteria bacterium]
MAPISSRRHGSIEPERTGPDIVQVGFLASTCSHGCLALTIELYRKGASTPAVVSFLLASPWASMSLTLL